MVDAGHGTLRGRGIAVVLGVAVIVAACLGSSVTPTTPPPSAVDAVSLDELPPDIAALIVRYHIPPDLFVSLPADVLADLDVSEADVQTVDDVGDYFEHRNARARWTAQCLTEAGWPSVVDPPGSNVVVYRGTNAPEMATSVDLKRCNAEAILRFPPPPPPETRQDWQTVYQRKVDTALCLEREGHDVPEPPSLDAFIDSGGEWDPYLAVDDVPNDEWNRLLGVCPQP